MLLVQPSSSAAERVFSFLQKSCSSFQDALLDDCDQASLMLQYNKCWIDNSVQKQQWFTNHCIYSSRTCNQLINLFCSSSHSGKHYIYLISVYYYGTTYRLSYESRLQVRVICHYIYIEVINILKHYFGHNWQVLERNNYWYFSEHRCIAW